MTLPGILQILIYFAILLALTKPLGTFLARVYQGERTFLHPVLGWLERLIYRLGGLDPNKEQDWKVYTLAMLLFSVVGLLLSYLIFRFQQLLPFNPQGFGPVAPDLSFNTAVSFT